MKKADLSPPLGWMGGPCKVVQRIEDAVRSPALREDLSEKVEHGQKLTNPEAAKIYTIETDKGGGVFRAIKITPHAQYRMDQRGITVGDLRVALMHFSKQLNDWKSQQSWEWTNFQQDSMRGEPIEYNDKKLGNLRVVFVNDRGTAKIVSTYWVGMADPRPETCGLHPRHARTVEDMSGYRTMVKDPSPTKSDTGEGAGGGKYPTQGLPNPPWVKNKPLGPMMFNVPGESGSNSDGTIHKDKVRTKGTPGGGEGGKGQTHPDTPYNNTGITPQRRPGMTADDGLFDEDELFDEDGMWVEAAGYKPQFLSPHPPGNKRQKKQKGRAYRYFHKRYVRKRGLIKRMVKRRDKRLQNNGRYKVRKEKAEEMPERHKRRPGGGPATIAERSKRDREKAKKASETFPFFHYPTEEWGEVIEVSPLGAVHYILGGGEREVVDFETFFDEAVLDEEHLDMLLNYMDVVFDGDDLDDDDDDSEEFQFDDSEDPEDPLFDAWMTEHELSKVALGDFVLKQRPSQRRRKQRGIDKVKAKLRYKQNRMKSRAQSKKRYKRLKRNPQFKKQQQIRRKHPERFKMLKVGEVLTAPEIGFVLELDPQGNFVRADEEAMGTLVMGYVRNISGMTGLVSFYLKEPGTQMLRSLPVREFLTVAGFLSEEDEDAMYELIDAEVGIEAYGDPEETDSDLINLYTIGSGFMHPREKREVPDENDELLRDPSDDDFYYGAVIKLANEVIGTFFREQRPPDMDPDTVYDRGNDHGERKRRDRKPGEPGLGGPHDKEVEDSNPGSRVYPTNKDHVEKTAALIHEIREGCGSDLVGKSSGLDVKLARVDRKNAVWLFNVQGSKSPYRVRLKATRSGNIRDFQKLHVKVSCSCPFWQWQGPEFHAKQGDYLYGKPRGLATKPDVKDPGGKHGACKHVLAVLSFVTDKNWQVPAAQRRMARYLADSLRSGEMSAEFPAFDMSCRRVAARYLASMEVRDA